LARVSVAPRACKALRGIRGHHRPDAPAESSAERGRRVCSELASESRQRDRLRRLIPEEPFRVRLRQIDELSERLHILTTQCVEGSRNDAPRFDFELLEAVQQALNRESGGTR